MFTQRREDNLLTLSYKELHIFATIGTSAQSLTEIAAQSYGLQFTLPRRERGRDFLAGYHLNPYMDVTVIQLQNGEKSLVACTLEGCEGKKVCNTFLAKLDWKRSPLPQEFIEDLARVGGIPWVEAYEGFLGATRGTKMNPRDLFYMALHTNFLQEYLGFPEEQAMSMAAQAFKIQGFTRPEEH